MNQRKILLFFVDLAIILCVTVGAALILPAIRSMMIEVEMMHLKVAVLACCLLLSRCTMKIYSSIWRYAGVHAYLDLIAADGIGYAVYILLGRLIPILNPGFSYTTICVMAILLTTLISRFAYQSLYAQINRSRESENTSGQKIGIAIIGAGNVGTALAEELMRNPRSRYVPRCFIDKDRSKVGNLIHGIRIYAEDDRVYTRLRELQVQELIIALPDADAEVKAHLYEKYKKTGCKIKLYDYPLERGDGVAGKRSVREVKIEDLLFRDTIKIRRPDTMAFYESKTILVTGGGGSIGSELCRQIARCQPRKLIIVDIYENNAYDIQQELKRKYGDSLELQVDIASVRDSEKIDAIFEKYRPDMVFHAAAHKHVPLMEDSPDEAIKNNVFGTYNVANAAEKYGVKKFVLISTDKAVNPTNIMGATKRLCEMLIQSRGGSKTEFVAVRFGNVLGSNGSVIPLFKQQIAAGGPVTLTDKRIIRYFMTIPEAVGLVMESGSMARGGELYVLDMGKPVKILELAEKMIQLSGFTPYVDIDIVEIGLRPGEKLYEELLVKTEELDKTENNLIFIERDRPLSREQMDGILQDLLDAVHQPDREAAVEAVKRAVPTYRAPVKA